MLLVRSDVSAGNSLSVPQLMVVLSLSCISIFESAVSEINSFDLIGNVTMQ